MKDCKNCKHYTTASDSEPCKECLAAVGEGRPFTGWEAKQAAGAKLADLNPGKQAHETAKPKTPGEMIDDATNALENEVKAALVKFTTETGVVVPAVTWATAVNLDDEARMKAAEYYCFTAEIKLGNRE